MKYDLIVIGGGPAGLTAAKTASEDGLKVLLLERKSDITATPRTDVSIFYWKFLLPDEYIEPVTVEMGTGVPMQSGCTKGIDVKTTFNFLSPGFSIDYMGPTIPYYHYIKMSPSGKRVYCIKDDLWGFYFSRECMLASLLDAVQKTKAEVWTGATVLGTENTPDGVKVRVRTKSGEQILEAQRAIAADGMDSGTVDSLGLNENRTSSLVSVVGYILDGVEPDVYDRGAWFSFEIPDITWFMIYLGYHAEGGNLNLWHLVTDSEQAIHKFTEESRYATWFRNAKLVRKTAFAGHSHAPMLKNPVAGNVLIISDAIATESFIQGAIACGYQGAKATLKELSGQPGYSEYTNWLHQAFAFFAHPDHFKRKTYRLAFSLARPNNSDMDTIFRLMNEQGVRDHPAGFITQNPELVKAERPEFYDRLKTAIERIDRRIARGGWDTTGQHKK